MWNFSSLKDLPKFSYICIYILKLRLTFKSLLATPEFYCACVYRMPKTRKGKVTSMSNDKLDLNDWIMHKSMFKRNVTVAVVGFQIDSEIQQQELTP